MCIFDKFKKKNQSPGWFYRSLISKYDKRLVDAVLAVFAKGHDVSEENFDPQTLCLVFEQSTEYPEDRATVERTLATYDALPVSTEEKIRIARELLREVPLGFGKRPRK